MIQVVLPKDSCSQGRLPTQTDFADARQVGRKILVSTDIGAVGGYAGLRCRRVQEQKV
jgi:hypothetical protein